MGKLLPISSKEVIKKLENIGYVIIRQKGSHVRMKNNHKMRLPVTIPNHSNKDVSIGVLRKVVRDANISVDKFNSL